MKQVLIELENEYQKLMCTPPADVFSPVINESLDISGFNLLKSALFAANRGLSGYYTTVQEIKNKKYTLEDNNTPTLTLLGYTITETMLIPQTEINHLLPNFNPDNKEHIALLENSFKQGNISSFPTYRKEKAERYFGEMIEVNIGKPILNYKKFQAIPNEYIKEKQEFIPQLNWDNTQKTKIENTPHTSLSEALLTLFIVFKELGQANLASILPENKQIDFSVKILKTVDDIYSLSKSKNINDLTNNNKQNIYL